MGIPWKKMPYPLRISLLSTVKNPSAIQVSPLPEWQHYWKLSGKGKWSEGSTGGSGRSPPTSVVPHPTGASRLSFLWHITSTHREGTQLGLTHPCTSSSTFAFYYASLGWKDWGPRMCLEERKDSAVWSMGLLRADHGKWVRSPYHTPLQDHRQSVQTYSEFFTLSCSLNQLAYSHFSFLQHLCESSPNSFLPHGHCLICLAILCLFSSLFSCCPTVSSVSFISSFSCCPTILPCCLSHFPVFCSPYLWRHATTLV